MWETFTVSADAAAIEAWVVSWARFGGPQVALYRLRCPGGCRQRQAEGYFFAGLFVENQGIELYARELGGGRCEIRLGTETILPGLERLAEDAVRVLKDLIVQQWAEVAAMPMTEAEPSIPSRPKDLQRWKATWGAVKGQWERTADYDSILIWLRRMHPTLACSEDTLAAICKAGDAKLLG